MTTYAKAIVSALIAGLTAVATGLAEGGISSQEWVTAAIAFLVGLGVTAAVPNKLP